MRKKLLFALCIISMFVYVTSVNAAPLKVEEKRSEKKALNFNPLYASIPGKFEIVTKEVDGSYVIFYLSDTDSVLSLSERSYHGQEIHRTDSTELIIKDGVKYHYNPYRNRPDGGVLTWIKNNILFEMSSIYFDENTMIHYAATIK